MPTEDRSRPAPHLRLSRGDHDRLGVRRTDDAWLEEHFVPGPGARVLVVAGTRVRPEDGRIAWVDVADAPDGERVLLGERADVVHWAVLADRSHAQADAQTDAQTDPRTGDRDGREAWLPLRGLRPVLQDGDPGEAALVLHALGIAEWRAVTRFCPRCGRPLEMRSAGHHLVCAEGHGQFPRTDPAVIMVVTDGEPGSPEERCLLGRSPAWPAGRYSTLAGFYEPGESLEDTVRREVAEETGIVVGRGEGDVVWFGNQPWPLPASLMLGFLARATSSEISVDHVEIEDARWFTRSEMRAETEAGRLVLPGGVSISRSLIEHWYGAALPGAW